MKENEQKLKKWLTLNAKYKIIKNMLGCQNIELSLGNQIKIL